MTVWYCMKSTALSKVVPSCISSPAARGKVWSAFGCGVFSRAMVWAQKSILFMSVFPSIRAMCPNNENRRDLTVEKSESCSVMQQTSVFLTKLCCRGDLPQTALLLLLLQDAQLLQRDRAAGCIIVFAKSKTLELGDNDLRTL